MNRNQIMGWLVDVPTDSDAYPLVPTSFPVSAGRLPTWLPKNLWHYLTEPIFGQGGPGSLHQRRLLSSVLLILMAAAVGIGLTPYMFFNVAPDRYFYLVAVSIQTMMFLYLLSRSKHYTAAASFTVVFLSVITFVLAVPDAQVPEPALLVYLVIPVILSSLLLSTLATSVLLSSEVLGMLGYQECYGLSSNDSWIGFVLVASILVMMAAHHWRIIERERQATFATERNLLRAVLDHVPDYVYVKDTETRFMFQNKSIMEKMGVHSNEEFVGKTDSDFYPPEYAVRYQSDDYQVMHSGVPLINHEELTVDTDGQLGWLLTTKVPLRNNGGQVVGMVGIGRDITGRKQAENQLSLYNRRLDVLHALDRSVLTGKPLEIIGQSALQSLCQLLPCSHAYLALRDPDSGNVSLLGNRAELPPSSAVVLPSIRSWAVQTQHAPKQRLVRDLLGTDAAVPEWVRSRGMRTFLNTTLVADNDLLGELWLGADGPNAFDDRHCEIAQEVADQLAIAFRHAILRQRSQLHTTDLENRVEQRTSELNRAMQRVEAILNNSSDGIVLANADGTIMQTNPTFDRLLGCRPDALFHQHLTTIAGPGHSTPVAEALDAVVGKGEIRQVEIEVRRTDGSTFFAEIGLSLIAGGPGQRSNVVCMLRDISERKRAEAELRKALEKEKELNELKSRFVSMASHEFRTPLTTISSSTELLQRYIERMSLEQKNNHFARIDAAIHHMIQLLEDVLFFGRADANRVPVKPTLLDLRALCKDALDAAQAVAGPNLELLFNHSDENDPVVMDEKMVKQIIYNLVSNAVKYSPAGGTVTLDLSYVDDHAVIRVSDQGIGISKKDQEHLGEPFYRGDNVETIKGTGLGMTIVRRAVELQGGQFEIESELGHGTTVIVTLPVHVSETNGAQPVT